MSAEVLHFPPLFSRRRRRRARHVRRVRDAVAIAVAVVVLLGALPFLWVHDWLLGGGRFARRR